jgi:hypothetical protein
VNLELLGRNLEELESLAATGRHAELDATVRRLVPEYHVEPHPAERAEGDPSTAAAS